MRNLMLCSIAVIACVISSCNNESKRGTNVEVGPGGVKVTAPGTDVNVSPEGVKVDAPDADVDVRLRGVEVKTPSSDVQVDRQK